MNKIDHVFAHGRADNPINIAIIFVSWIFRFDFFYHLLAKRTNFRRASDGHAVRRLVTEKDKQVNNLHKIRCVRHFVKHKIKCVRHCEEPFLNPSLTDGYHFQLYFCLIFSLRLSIFQIIKYKITEKYCDSYNSVI